MAVAQRIKRIPVNTRTKAWQDYKTYRYFHWGLGGLGIFSLFYAPVWFMPLLTALFVIFFIYLYSEYLEEPKKTIYNRLLRPYLTPKHFIQIGYEVPAEEPFFTAHINALEEGGSALKEREIQAKKEPHRIIGFSKSLIGKHLLVVGTTGAGKTSLIMTLLKTIMGLGGGAIFVDGKGDSDMTKKCYRIAEKQERTVDFYIISFIEPEKVGFDTNTMNPLATLSAAGQVTFFMALATAASGGASGDKAYWLGRGKVLFQPIIYFNYLRRKYYGETYSIETLNQYLALEMFSELSAMATAMAIALDKRLENSRKLSKLKYDALKRYTPTTIVPTLEAVVNYLTQFPYRQLELSKVGITFPYASFVYQAYSLSVISYLKGLDQGLAQVVEQKAKEIFALAQKEGKDLLSLSILELRELVQKVKGNKNFLDFLQSKKMVEQHNYAQHQWTETLQSLSVYSNVFGATDPDVDFVDVVKNAKLVYVLLPSLSADEKTRNMLGNIIVNAAKGAMSLALGGKLDRYGATALRIITQVIKPEPLGMLILDEYGAYPVPEVDVILAQARSLKWGVLIAVQDLTSLRVGGTNETSLRKAFANTVSKFIMENFDRETSEWLTSIMPQWEVVTEGTFEDADELAPSGVLNVAKEYFIEPKRAVDFSKGFGILFSEGKICLMQTFWADENAPEFLKINRYRKVV